MDASAAVADLLELSGLTKSELSRQSGVSRALIDDYLKGRRQPTVAQLTRLGESAGFRAEVVWVDQRPASARPKRTKSPTPMTVKERAVALERACESATALDHRETGKLMFPPFRELLQEQR